MAPRGLMRVHIPEAVHFHDGFVMAIETGAETRPQPAAIGAVAQTFDGDIVEIGNGEFAVAGQRSTPQFGEAHGDLFEFGVQGRLARDHAQDVAAALPAFHALDRLLEFFDAHVFALGLMGDEPRTIRALQMALGAIWTISMSAGDLIFIPFG